ncbi:hypothetical protein EDD15DRAFT_2369058 [Pisolithus albus]|nr:hypothetical protein EDD15DRAFT_2369058 [Pisolithus albus]
MTICTKIPTLTHMCCSSQDTFLALNRTRLTCLGSNTSVHLSPSYLAEITDTRAKLPSAFDTPVSRLKERSFTSPSTTLMQQGGRQDATVYRHEDIPPPGGFYQSSVWHIDRNAVWSLSRTKGVWRREHGLRS